MKCFTLSFEYKHVSTKSVHFSPNRTPCWGEKNEPLKGITECSLVSFHEFWYYQGSLCKSKSLTTVFVSVLKGPKLYIWHICWSLVLIDYIWHRKHADKGQQSTPQHSTLKYKFHLWYEWDWDGCTVDCTYIDRAGSWLSCIYCIPSNVIIIQIGFYPSFPTILRIFGNH